MEDSKKQECEQSPCESCTIAKCENKNCSRWRDWFVRKWDYTVDLLRPHLAKMDCEDGQEKQAVSCPEISQKGNQPKKGRWWLRIIANQFIKKG